MGSEYGNEFFFQIFAQKNSHHHTLGIGIFISSCGQQLLHKPLGVTELEAVAKNTFSPMKRFEIHANIKPTSHENTHCSMK